MARTRHTIRVDTRVSRGDGEELVSERRDSKMEYAEKVKIHTLALAFALGLVVLFGIEHCNLVFVVGGSAVGLVAHWGHSGLT